MQIVFDAIAEWSKGLLVDGIMGDLGGLSDNVNMQVGEIVGQMGTTPASWNAGVFSMMRQLPETITPSIAGLVPTFVMCYELIQLPIERNSLHDVDTWIFFEQVFKTSRAVPILSNTFNVVMAVSGLSQYVVQQSAGLIQGNAEIPPDMLVDLEAQLEAMELGPLLGL